jgi:hypothetical protein
MAAVQLGVRSSTHRRRGQGAGLVRPAARAGPPLSSGFPDPWRAAGRWMDQFHYRWNMEISPRYVAVAINFHGSTGFGQAPTPSATGAASRRRRMKADYVQASYDSRGRRSRLRPGRRTAAT